MKKIICLLLTLILMLSTLTACNHSTSANKYKNAARKAAKALIEQEVQECTWTSVDVGKLTYRYTLYCEELDQYEVDFVVKFVEMDEMIDQWLHIRVTLTGKTLSVLDTKCSYMDAEIFEESRVPDKMYSGEYTWENIDNINNED